MSQTRPWLTPKVPESLKGGKGETRAHYLLPVLMMMCVSWSSWSSTPRRFGSRGWAEAGLEGRRSPWACSSCIPEAGSHRCGAGAEKPPWQDPHRAPLHHSPLRPLHALSQRVQLRGTEPFARAPTRRHVDVLTLQSAFLRAGRALLTSSPPASGSTGPWPCSTLLFPNSSAASSFQKPHVWHRRCPLCCRKPWFGDLGGGEKGHRRPPGRWSQALRHFCCCPPKPH